jgi:hypothetical protein
MVTLLDHLNGSTGSNAVSFSLLISFPDKWSSIIKWKLWLRTLKYSYSKTLNRNVTYCFAMEKYFKRKMQWGCHPRCFRQMSTSAGANCKEEMSFVCSLPAMCHQDACRQKCAADKDNYFCKVLSPELEPPKCLPQCPTVDCSESVLKKYTKPSSF